MTQNVYAQTGFLFGGLYDKELGLRKPLKVNIFDTPGFADVDIDNICMLSHIYTLTRYSLSQNWGE